MPLLRHSDLSFHVQTMGEGPPLVLAHGLLVGSMASWYFTAAPALAATGHRVVLYDLRGHGRSARATSGYDLETQCDDLEGVLRALDYDPDRDAVSLAGHSYGALVALRYAQRRPALVPRLALVEAPLPPSRFEQLTSFLSRSPAEMLEALPETARSLFGKPGRQAERLLASLAFLSGETTLLRDLNNEPDVPDEALSAVTSRTLCVYGTQSSCYSVGERLTRVMPNATLETLEGGHFLPTERPRELATVLSEFFHG